MRQTVTRSHSRSFPRRARGPDRIYQSASSKKKDYSLADRHVAARPMVNRDWVILADRFVILLEFAPESASLAANDRVFTGMIGRFAVVYSCTDQVLL